MICLAAGKAASNQNIEVKVREPDRVVHEGVAYTGGDVLEVPNDDERDEARWVELVSETKTRSADFGFGKSEKEKLR